MALWHPQQTYQLVDVWIEYLFAIRQWLFHDLQTPEVWFRVILKWAPLLKALTLLWLVCCVRPRVSPMCCGVSPWRKPWLERCQGTTPLGFLQGQGKGQRGVFLWHSFCDQNSLWLVGWMTCWTVLNGLKFSLNWKIGYSMVQYCSILFAFIDIYCILSWVCLRCFAYFPIV